MVGLITTRSSFVLRAALCLSLGIPQQAQASLLAKLFFYFRTSTASSAPKKQKLEGQFTKSFKLRKAKAQDVVIPVQNYLDGISKTGGSVQVRETDNSLVVTDFPENVQNLSTLMEDIDQVYANADPMARQMLVTQNLMKSIRLHAGAFSTTASANHSVAPSDKAVVPPAVVPVNPPPLGVGSEKFSRSRKEEEEFTAHPVIRSILNPSLGQFEVVGWIKDEKGYTVVLTNEGRRFVYKAGKIHGGYDTRSEPVAGLTGVVHDEQLILNDQRTHVSLKMLKWHSL